MRTAQEIFDIVKNHLLTQMSRSMDFLSNNCMYRDAHGRKCAVGCLIPDNQYRPSMEGKIIDGLLKDNLLFEELKGEFSRHIILLSELQHIHDKHLVGNWESELKLLAARHQLNWN